MYSMLKGRELSDEDEEALRVRASNGSFKKPEPVDYNPAIPIETFDFIVTDECHRSIYNLWRAGAGILRRPPHRPHRHAQQADLRLLQPEPRHGIRPRAGRGRRRQRQLRRLPHPHRITAARLQGRSRLLSCDKRDRATRAKRWEQLDDDFAYDPNQLDRDVVAPDQIRTIVKAFRDKLFTEIFPGRTEVPKTLIFAKDDAHAEDIVEILREEFGKGNDFCPEDHLSHHRREARRTSSRPSATATIPRIAVTVDMIATGTDIKPLEIVVFMRAVKSRTFFEQMKGRGVRVIKPDDLQGRHARRHKPKTTSSSSMPSASASRTRPTRARWRKSPCRLRQAAASRRLGNTEEDVLIQHRRRLRAWSSAARREAETRREQSQRRPHAEET